MALCNHCKADVTLTPTAANKCPACGADILAPSVKSPADTTREEDFLGEMTVAFTPGGVNPIDAEDSESGIAGVELDFTQVFGGKFVDGDDLGEDSGFDEIALDEGSAPELTQALGSSPSESGGSSSSSRSGETVRRRDSATAPDATHVVGDISGDSAQSEWPSGVTVPTGLSGSDRAGSGTPQQTHREDETILHDSGTLAMGSGRRSSEIHTPHSREITGLSSGRTIPRGPLGEGGASRSLKAGDVQFVGPEQVRLRAFGLSEGTNKDLDVDFLLRASAGKGGMGIVYRSLQRSLDRDVAVKQMKPDLADSESDRNKFLTEAVITGQLEHPNIIPVHELGLAADGLPFYAMKYVIGDDWEDRLKKLSEQENLNILIQVANAIAFAHSRNVIHRDLKPGNVRLGNFGEVLVMDWGLAARLDREGDIPPAGTPLYMAPETALEYLDHVGQQSTGGQVKSSRRVKAGTYSDIYLLGALLFKVVTGKAPHSGKTPFECLRNAARNRIVKVERSSELLDIAYKAMATEPADRYRSVPEFVDALKAYQAHAQSIQITRRAAEDLSDAEEQRSAPGVNSTATYAMFSSAQHSFQNALDLWPENRKAKEHLVKCRQLFADTAYTNGDFDLALSLLDGEEETHSELVSNIRIAQRQRQTRLAWFRTLQYATAASLMVAVAFIVYSFYAKQDAFRQRQLADAAKASADFATQEADKQKELARIESLNAEKQKQLAEDATQQAKDANLLAEKSKADAADAKKLADEAEKLAAEAQMLAENAKQTAQRERFFATAGLVNSTLLERGAYAAWKEIEKIKREDPAVIEGADDAEKDKVEWTRLVRDSDWQSEASEINSIQLAQPLLQVSADGQWLAVAGNDQTGPQLCLFDINGFEKPVHSVKLAQPVQRFSLSPNGKIAATLNERGQLSVVEFSTGRVSQLDNGAGMTTAMAFDPSGTRLLTGQNKLLNRAGSQKGSLTEWRMDDASGTFVPRFVDSGEHHQHPIVAVGYSSDGGVAFSADGGGSIRLWDSTVPQKLTLRPGYRHGDVASGSSKITAAAWGVPTSEHVPLAYGCSDGNVYLLRVPFSNLSAGAQDAAIADNSNSAEESQFVFAKTIIPAWKSDPRLTPDKMSRSHLQSVSDLSFSQDGNVLLSSGGDTIYVHNASRDAMDVVNERIERKESRRYHDTTINSCAAGAESTAYSSDASGRVLQWKIDVPPDSRTVDQGRSTGKVTAIEVSPGKSSRIAVTDSGGYTRVWTNEARPKLLDQSVIGHDQHRQMQAWHIPGMEPLIVTVAEDHRACIWDANTGALLRSIDLGLRSVVAVSAGGDSVLAATDLQADSRKPGYTAERIAARSFPFKSSEYVALWEDYPRVSALHSFRDKETGDSIVAVGLRDGQIQFWRFGNGRISLADPANRPHWRAIQAFAFDDRNEILFAADNDGTISRWEIRDGAPFNFVANRLKKGRAESVIRFELSSDGARLLAVVRGESVGPRELRLLDANNLALSEQQPAKLNDLVDATFSSDGQSLLAIRGKSGIQQFNLSDRQWIELPLSNDIAKSLSAGESLAGLRTDADGSLLLYGPGFAQLWSGVTGDAQLVSRIQSRPQIQFVGFRSGDPSQVRSLSDNGRLDLLSHAGGDRYERKGRVLASLENVTLATAAETEGEALLAIRDSSDGTTRIERWNLDEGKRIEPLSEPFQENCVALAADAKRVAYAAQEKGKSWAKIRDLTTGADSDLIELPAGIQVTSLSLSPSDNRLLICTQTGNAYIAQPDANGNWQTTEIDRDDVSVAIFSPRGERLILGTNTGQVQIVKPQEGDGELIARLLLTLPGHSHPVTTLRFAEQESRLSLLSGDAAGRVLIHPLQ